MALSRPSCWRFPRETARFEALCLSLPATPWIRLLDTDHFFAGALTELAQACRDAIAWSMGDRAR